MKYLIAFLLIANLSFAQEWSETKLNDFSSIDFPNAPEKSESNGDVYYSTSDDNSVYLVMIRSLRNQKMPQSELPKFYKGFMNGALKSVNGELIEQNEFDSNGLIGNEMVYLANSNPQLPNLRHKRILAANKTLISYEFWTYKENGELTSSNKDKFFNSISVSSEKGIEQDEDDRGAAFEMGFAFGKMIFYLLIVALIVGGILLIRKLKRKKIKNVG